MYDSSWSCPINKTITFETVRQVAFALPGVEDGTAFGKPALKVRGKLLASVPANRSVEPNSLVVRVSPEQKDELLTSEPEVYYLTEHYEGYDKVLVRLYATSIEALRGLLAMSYKYVSRILNFPNEPGSTRYTTPDKRRSRQLRGRFPRADFGINSSAYARLPETTIKLSSCSSLQHVRKNQNSENLLVIRPRTIIDELFAGGGEMEALMRSFD